MIARNGDVAHFFLFASLVSSLPRGGGRPAQGRAERLLGWRPQYGITEGIRHSLEWAALRGQLLGDDVPPARS